MGSFRGRLTIAFGSVVLYSLGWAMAGIRYWFLLGIDHRYPDDHSLRILDRLALAVLLKYLDVLSANGVGLDPMTILVWPSLAYLLVQFIESWLLTPWVQSQSMDMNAVTVLIVLFVGGALGGFYGLLLAIPLSACAKILGEELLLPQLARQATGPTCPIPNGRRLHDDCGGSLDRSPARLEGGHDLQSSRDGINGIYEALRTRRDRIKLVLVRHEESAALVACGYINSPGDWESASPRLVLAASIF